MAESLAFTDSRNLGLVLVFPHQMMYKKQNQAGAAHVDAQFDPQVFIDADRISIELSRRFGLTIAELNGVGHGIHRAFVQVTSLHPKGFNGTSGWAEGTSQLRAIMIPKGWHAEDPQGQPRVVAKDRKTGITLSSGNPDTGVPHRVPQTRNDKGTQTASSVSFNAKQGTLFPFVTSDNAPIAAKPPAKGQALWILLYYIDFDANELRLELSQPTGMSEADKVNGWSIRYILPSIPLGPELDDQRNDESPDIDFDVTPKLQ